jgi:succinoglycan biosynthesis transport protein ExoP
MKDSSKNAPPDSGFQLMEPMANNHAPKASKFRLQKFLFFFRKLWWLPALTGALGAGAAVYIFYHTPPTFVSYGTLWESERLRLPDGVAFTYDKDNFIGTLTEVLRGNRMRELTTNSMAQTHPDQIIKDKDGYILPVQIQVYASPKSSIYTIEVRSSNPGFTPNYLNVLMEQYIVFRSITRNDVSEHTLSNVKDQIETYERNMNGALTALTDYEGSNNIAVLQEENTVEANHLATLRTQLSNSQLEMNLLAARELEPDSGDLLATNSSDTIFDSLRGSGSTSSAAGRQDAARQIELLKLDREKFAKYMRPEPPKIVKLDEDIAHAQKLIEVYRQQNHEQIAATRRALQIKIDNLQQSIKESEAKVSDANERLAKEDRLKQDVASKQRMFDRLSSLEDTIQVNRHIDTDTLDIMDRASPATRSYSEAKSMLIQCTFAGLGLGLGVIFLLAIRDDRFGSLAEVSETFGDSVVGQVPEIPGISVAKPLPLLECNDDRHMYAESYRNLRSALRFLAIDGQPPKTLLITSAVPDEGKSTVATNLARALALGGSKVLLVDGDLRKGRIHEMLKLQSKPGLSELLRQHDEPGKFIQTTDLPGFSFIARGSIARNPGDLFLSPAYDQLLAWFREQYDYVVIDSSPVFAADDTATMAPKADGTLFVVRSHFSHARIVREGLELLFQRQTRVLGLILNRTNPSARSYYFYKYPEYHSEDKTIEVESGS